MDGKKPRKKFCLGIRILLVDDNLVCGRVIGKLLEGGDNKVVAVNSATTALNLLEESEGGFDVVLTDVYMPIMDGFELLEVVGRKFKIPVVMMSGDERVSTIKKGLQAGACFYISKPLDFSKVENLWQFVVRDRIGGPTINSLRSAKDLRGSFLEHGENSRCNGKRKMVLERKDGKDEHQTTKKKERLIWTRDLHNRFLDAIRKLGHEKVVPRKILELMNANGLSRLHVASHLQKYRNFIKLIANSSQLVAEPRNRMGLVKEIHSLGSTPQSDPHYYLYEPGFQDSIRWRNADAGQSLLSINQGNVQHSGLENYFLFKQPSIGGCSTIGVGALPSVSNLPIGGTTMAGPVHTMPQSRVICLPSTSYQQGSNLQVENSFVASREIGTGQVGSYDTLNQFPNFNSANDSINNNDQRLRDEIWKGKRPMEEVDASGSFSKFTEFNTTSATMNLQVENSLMSSGEIGTGQLGSYDKLNQFPNFNSANDSINNNDQRFRDEIRKGKMPMGEVDTSGSFSKFNEFNTTSATQGKSSSGALLNPNQVQTMPQAPDLQEQQNVKEEEYVSFLDFVREFYPTEFNNIINEEDQLINVQQNDEEIGEFEFSINQLLNDGNLP